MRQYILIEWTDDIQPTLIHANTQAAARRKVVDSLHRNPEDFPQESAPLPVAPYTDEQVDAWFSQKYLTAGEDRPEIYEFDDQDVINADPRFIVGKGKRWEVLDNETGLVYPFSRREGAEWSAEEWNDDPSKVDNFIPRDPAQG